MSHQANDELKENKKEEDWEEYGAWTECHLCQHCQSLLRFRWEQEMSNKYDSHEKWWFNPIQKAQKFKEALPRFVQSLLD
tara:strand:+ start:699 stop:938 length:240 start_codon:yes stop_codon:yes gene_type:complete